MARCRSQRRISATLPRRNLLIGAASLALAACGEKKTLTASHTPTLDMARLDKEVGALALRAKPGILGFGLTNLESGQYYTLNGDRRFPMQSVFKAALGAAVLAEVDAGRLPLAETVQLSGLQLSPPHSPIADAWPERRDYTLDELLVAAVSDSDNTAADVLMKRIGGPGAVTAWLRSKNVDELRVDRYERELQPDVYGVASFRAAWRGPGFATAVASVPPDKRRAAMAAYVDDPRDTATPRGMLVFLSKLVEGELLSAASTRRLIGIMAQSQRAGDRIKAGLPRGARFAHKPGTAGVDQGYCPAYNDVGIATLPDGRNYAVAAFLSGSTVSDEARASLFADLGRVIGRSVG